MHVSMKKITSPLQDRQIQLVTLHHGSSSEHIQCFFFSNRDFVRQTAIPCIVLWLKSSRQYKIDFCELAKVIHLLKFAQCLVLSQKLKQGLYYLVDFLCINQNDVSQAQIASK